MATIPERFETPRLLAERLQPEHFDEIHRMHQDPVQMELLGGVRDESQTAAYLERNLRHWADHGFGIWLLRDRAGQVAGRGMLRHVWLADRDEVEVGYSLHPAYWGQGLASEIAAACLDHGHRALRRSIVALTLPANLRSQRVLTRIGMTLEQLLEYEGQEHALFRSTGPAVGGPA